MANYSAYEHCENKYPKIGKIRKVEINLSVLTFLYLGGISLSSYRIWTNLNLKSKLQSFLSRSKENLTIEQEPFVLWSIKRLPFLGHRVCANIIILRKQNSCN